MNNSGRNEADSAGVLVPKLQERMMQLEKEVLCLKDQVDKLDGMQKRLDGVMTVSLPLLPAIRPYRRANTFTVHVQVLLEPRRESI